MEADACRRLESGESPDFHAIVEYGVEGGQLLYMNPAAGRSMRPAEDLFACRGWLACVAYKP